MSDLKADKAVEQARRIRNALVYLWMETSGFPELEQLNVKIGEAISTADALSKTDQLPLTL